ncbi:hypothetical protein AB1Y20_008988 [Prymnesium parvum]|uniref:Proteasome activator PA28 C-terminal domain-containing protein n=1 Tax=Prymnesium parvum TaxID=97485 RepID=A0AB34K2J8_PRYPA
MSASAPRNKRGRGSSREEGGSGAEGSEDLDVAELRSFLRKEEGALRSGANTIVNTDLLERVESVKGLEAKLQAETSYSAAIESGLVAELRKELSACYRIGVKLEAWVNTFTPPLSAGGNMGVSAEVQEGIFSIIHALTAGCGEATQRMLAYEKEHAVMRTKCTDEGIWERYKCALECTQLHDVRKACAQMYGDLLMIGNSICSNMSHLRADIKEESKNIVSMY